MGLPQSLGHSKELRLYCKRSRSHRGFSQARDKNKVGFSRIPSTFYREEAVGTLGTSGRPGCCVLSQGTM